MMSRLSELAEAEEEARYQVERQRRLLLLRCRDASPPKPAPAAAALDPAQAPPERISVPILPEPSRHRSPSRRQSYDRRRTPSPRRRSRSRDRRSSFPRSTRHSRPRPDRLRKRSWSRGRSVSSSRSRSRSPRRRPEEVRRRVSGFGLSTYRSEFEDRRLERHASGPQPDRAHLTNLLRETMIANRRLDIEQRDMAIHHLRNIAPEDLGRPITLMSEWLNSSDGALRRDNPHEDDDDNGGGLQPGLDMFGREPPRHETYQEFKARKLAQQRQ